MKSEPLFIGIKKAAELLGMSERHFVRRFINTGRIRPIGNGTRQVQHRRIPSIYLRADVEKLK
jgi:hypothetical protein